MHACAYCGSCRIPHATVGFAGLAGALTGMSAKGLTVHEANLEEAPETFFGFPWVLRLRYVALAPLDHRWPMYSASLFCIAATLMEKCRGLLMMCVMCGELRITQCKRMRTVRNRR